ncbi:MAG: HNH endonuclease [Candidatus Electrothrix sp. AUS1_2]|nr:HNH endonuclease [Candidatus Electrothrix sp. AUS1_2]
MSKTYIPVALRNAVYERAKAVCEYCLTPEMITFAPHQIDHVIAEKHGGATEQDNLALACILCILKDALALSYNALFSMNIYCPLNI